MTKIEIIRETVAFYSEDTSRRSTSSGIKGRDMCYYTNTDGNHCALGRCMLAEILTSIAHTTQNTSSAAQLSKTYDSLDNILEERYRGHSVSFWVDLQFLHDYGEYWDADGITVKGLNYVDALKDRFK